MSTINFDHKVLYLYMLVWSTIFFFKVTLLVCFYPAQFFKKKKKRKRKKGLDCTSHPLSLKQVPAIGLVLCTFWTNHLQVISPKSKTIKSQSFTPQYLIIENNTTTSIHHFMQHWYQDLWHLRIQQDLFFHQVKTTCSNFSLSTSAFKCQRESVTLFSQELAIPHPHTHDKVTSTEGRRRPRRLYVPMNSPRVEPDFVTEDIITKPNPSISRRVTVTS